MLQVKTNLFYLSTGASTIKEINNAINAIEEESTVDIAIMHSVLSYPTSFEDANLMMIKDLVENFKDYEIGYSDHTKSDSEMLLLTTAYNYGATILEKHFTLDKTLKGNDHCYSMDPSDVEIFNKNISFINKINGKKNKQPLICESSARKQSRRSIVVVRDIKEGEKITRDLLTFKRPGNGIYPSEINDVIGKVAKKNIPQDTLLDFEMLE